MSFIFELSKEHKTLPKAEIVACLDAEHISYDFIDSNENIMIVKADIKEQKINF